ncbi:MAG TPA: hypothetical protein VHO29_19865 [Marmoricola sp.]|nr:hypothetical protein [Marmoricola sp.]
MDLTGSDTIELSGLTVSDMHGGAGRFHMTLDLVTLCDMDWILGTERCGADDQFSLLAGEIAWLDGTRHEFAEVEFFWEDSDTLDCHLGAHLVFALDRREADLLRGALHHSWQVIEPVHVAAAAAAAGVSPNEYRQAVASGRTPTIQQLTALAALRGAVIHPLLQDGDVLVLH